MTTGMHERRWTLGRRRLLTWFGLAGSGVILSPAFAIEPIGKVVSVDGSVGLQRDASDLDLSPDDPLLIADRVMTREDGFALLLLGDRTKINLGAASELTIDQFIVDQGGTISMGGAMLFDRPADLPPTDITILTAFGQIGVRGTTFFAGPTKGRFSVFVDHGSVAVIGGGEERVLMAGEGVEFEAVGSPPGPVVKWGKARIDEAYASVRVGR